MKRATIFLFTLLFYNLLHATDYTWTGGAATGNWSELANWNPGVPGGVTGDKLFITGATYPAMTNDHVFAFGQLIFDPGTASRTISGTTNCVFYAQSQAIQNSSGNIQTIDFPFQIGNNASGDEVSFVTGNGLVLNKAIDLRGNTLTLEGNNTYSPVRLYDAITATSGMLKIRNGAYLEIGSGGSVANTTIYMVGSRVKFEGTGTLGLGTKIELQDNGELDLNGKIIESLSINDQNSNTIKIGSGSLKIVGDDNSDLSTTTITGESSGSIIKLGAGTLTIANAAAYSGEINVNSGSVVVNNNPLDIAKLSVASGATFTANVNVSAVNLNVQGNLHIESGKTITASGVVNITGAVTGGGSIHLANDAQIVATSLPLPSYFTNTENAEVVVAAGTTLTLSSSQSVPKLRLVCDETNGQAALNLTNSSSLTVSGTTTVEQTLGSIRNYYLSSPTGSAPTASAPTTFYTYKENTNSSSISDYWVSGGTIAAGSGFITSAANTNLKLTFTGNLNNGDVSVGLTHGGQIKTGFNLVGNPYPSFIDIENLDFTNLEKTVWVRTVNAGSYIFSTVNGSSGVGTFGVSEVLPPLQAFWVRCTSATTLTFTNSIRTTGAVKLKAPSKSGSNVLRLVASNGSRSDESVIYFNENAKYTYDDYDSRKMSNDNSSIPEIYSMASGQQLVINGMPAVRLNEEIPLGFKTGVAGTGFSIKATELPVLGSGVSVILKDGNVETDITGGNAYIFSSPATDTYNRFSIIFRSSNIPASDNNPVDDGRFCVLTGPDKVLKVVAPVPDNSKVIICGLSGQQMKMLSIQNGFAQTETTAFTPGVYTVRIYNADSVITKKIILK